MRAVWFRNDLRLYAHSPLRHALDQGDKVVAVYALCTEQWQRHGVAPLRQWYVLNSLLEWGEALAAKGIDCHVLNLSNFDQVAKDLPLWLQQQGVTQVYCNREYPVHEKRRDKQVAETLSAGGIAIKGFDDNELVPPRALKTGQGTPYTVYTPYKKQWDKRMDVDDINVRLTVPAWPGGHGEFHGKAEIEAALATLNLPTSLTSPWQPGEQAAQRQLAEFCSEHIASYKAERDIPSIEGTSRLSAALSAGLLSPAQCYQQARQALADPASREGAACWIGELAWRDFYRQIMAHFPTLSWGKAFRPETDYIEWQQDDELFDAWAQGRTGFPLVDAGMRQLVATGWMHNRLRMLTAMFLSKHLLLDWRRGETFFMQHLIDGDFAANNGGWQWSASTGTDAAPYFRVFSPIRQSERFDPQGTFIRQWLPELADLNSKEIHTPWKYPSRCPEYPAPVVEHQGVRERVTAAFKQAKSHFDAHNEQ